MTGAGQHRAVEVGFVQRHIGVWAHPLKSFDHAIVWPSQNDDMSIGDNDPHPALGDRVLFAHSGEHSTPHNIALALPRSQPAPTMR